MFGRLIPPAFALAIGIDVLFGTELTVVLLVKLFTIVLFVPSFQRIQDHLRKLAK